MKTNSRDDHYSNTAVNLRRWLRQAYIELFPLLDFSRTKGCPQYVRESIDHLEIGIRSGLLYDIMDRPPINRRDR